MQFIVDKPMSNLINNDQEAFNRKYASGSENEIFDSYLSSLVLLNNSRTSVSKPGMSDWHMNSCLEETDRRAVERAENEGMI